ncbi:outer membrane protein assembly factor BamB family protein [Halobacterium rubrum]|jgi:outer membrane protein assembly factor BamB|uniref:outer membrane protein assembly factor BamB family protein n=1 Tax=Halobacterium TaxID=2239 RepID=UPI001F37648F|nr:MULTISPECIES: PQQ-binding-like beta-propeller repeat protein [Halobacterium]MDH5021840.1 PQQ-binding-like beta-propeller repeat protein [Halobacterium rubrum]
MERRRLLANLGAGIAMTVAGCSSLTTASSFQLDEDCDQTPASTLWGQRSAGRTGRSAVDRSVPVKSTATLHALGDGTDDPLASASAAPVLTGKYAVTPTFGGLVALDRTTGEREWAFSLPEDEGVATTPVVTCGVVIAATSYSNTYVVDLETGEQVGTIPTSGTVLPENSPVLSGSTLLVSDTGVSAYGLQAGETHWSDDTRGVEGFCADDSFTYVTHGKGIEPAIQAIELETGDVEWALNTSAGFDTAPAISNGLLYAISNTQELVCVSAADGTVQWRRQLRRNGYARPAIAGDQVAVNAGQSEQSRVFHAETGDELTTVETGVSYTQPVFTEDALLFVGRDSGLVVLERSSLDVSARHPSVKNVDSQLSVGTEEAFYVPALSGGLRHVTFGG